MAARSLGRRVLLLAAVVLAASACNDAIAPPAPPAPAAVSMPPADMSLVFGDTFNGSALNTAAWDTCYPWANTAAGCTNHGNNELEWYLPEQAQVSGGALHLVATKTPTPGTTQQGQPMTYEWRSGMVTTNRSLEFTYGYVEISARIPKGTGFWPTLWTLPETQTWPPEIDIQENWGSDTFAMSPNFHSTTTGQHQGAVRFTTDMSSAFHTYGLDWEPGSLTWYVDGRVIHSYSGSDVPSEPMYVLANLAITGTQPPDASTPSTASFDIDFVRVYQR